MKEIWTAALKNQFFLEAKAELTFDAILPRVSAAGHFEWKIKLWRICTRPTFTSLISHISVNPHGTIIVQDEPPKNVQSIRHQCHPVSRGNFNVSIFQEADERRKFSGIQYVFLTTPLRNWTAMLSLAEKFHLHIWSYFHPWPFSLLSPVTRSTTFQLCTNLLVLSHSCSFHLLF